MLRNIVAAVKKAAVGWARSIGDAFKHRVRPARGDASIVVGAARDAVRPRSELVAENPKSSSREKRGTKCNEITSASESPYGSRGWPPEIANGFVVESSRATRSFATN